MDRWISKLGLLLRGKTGSARFWVLPRCSVSLLATASPGTFARPDSRLTLGALGTLGAVPPTRSQVCSRGYARAARHPYDAQWRRYRVAVFREYGIPHARWRMYTLDHLIPLELGGRPFGSRAGAWDLRNVWPEPTSEAKSKDAVEDALHAAVCYRRGFHGLHLALAQAQHAIVVDWTHTPVGLPSRVRHSTVKRGFVHRKTSLRLDLSHVGRQDGGRPAVRDGKRGTMPL